PPRPQGGSVLGDLACLVKPTRSGDQPITSSTYAHGQPPLTPRSRTLVKHAGDRRPALAAGAARQRPPGQPVPVAANDGLAAARAPGRPARFVVDVAGIDVAQAVAQADLARAGQRAGR